VEVQRATLVSTSIGAWAIIVLALTHPDRVERLIPITPEGIAPQPGELNPRGVDLNPATLEGLRQTLDALFFDKATWTNDQTVKALFTDKLQADYSFVFQKLIESGFVRGEFMVEAQQLSQLRVPTLFIWGQQDEIVTLSCGQRYASLVPGARLLVIENAGHLLQLE
jgi:pimeloyl-ACP methyl ester carboxylesterase